MPDQTSTHSTGRELQLCVMMPTWVGDACMATPTLRAIRLGYPDAKITMISRPIIKELIDGSWGNETPWIDDFLFVTKRGSDRAHSRFQLTKVSRGCGFDVAVLLTNSLWSAAVMRLAGVRRIVGYDRDARGWLLSDRIKVPLSGRKLLPISAVDYYLELARHIGCDTTRKEMHLNVAAEADLAARELWNRAGFDGKTPTLVINNSAATDPSRIWPTEFMIELALRTTQKLGWQVLLHCGPQERDAANAIALEVNHPRIASMGIADELPIGLSKAVLRRASVVVSSDSGPRHMAVALNRPVVSLFGATDPAWTTTYNRSEVILQAKSATKKTMAEISVDSVFAAVEYHATSEGSSNKTAAA